MSDQADIQIVRTQDVAAVVALGTAAALEQAEHDMQGLQALWGAYHGERLVGAISWRRDAGRDLVGWLAVEEAYRGHGLGSRLLETMAQEARGGGVRRRWATARAPGFFLRNGFVEVEAGPVRDALLGGCPQCRQFGVTCEPQAVTRELLPLLPDGEPSTAG